MTAALPLRVVVAPWSRCAARVQRVQKVLPAFSGWVQRVVVAAFWTRPLGVRVQRVQKVQRVQRVMVAPFGRIIKMAPEAPTLPPWSGLYNYPLNQPGRQSRSRAEPGAPRGTAPAVP